MLETHLFEEVKTTYKRRGRTNFKINTSSNAYEYIKSILNVDEIIEEYFIALLLNRSSHVIGWYVVSIGSTSGTVVDAKKLFSTALNCLTHGIILCHNHPSGSLTPSIADIKLTHKLKESAKLLDITIMDHLIINHEGKYFSFADQGEL